MDLEWFKEYVSIAMPSGGEYNGQRFWLSHVMQYINDYIIDDYGNVTGIINPGKDFKVMLEAHCDEVAWSVKRINDDGYIQVEVVGGPDPLSALSQRATIHTRDHGPVKCVFGWPAIHTRDSSPKAKIPSKNSLFVDCACESADDVRRKGVRVGDFVTFDTNLQFMNHFMVGKALDNKASVLVLTEVAKRVRNLDFTLYLTCAVQEEVGHEGAKMAAYNIKPDCVIVLETAHDTSSPMITPAANVDIRCGRGPVLMHAAPVHVDLAKLIQDTAEDAGIRIQLDVAGEKTLSDVDVFAYEAGGTPSALLCLPLRYMHSTVEMVHIDDIEEMIKLVLLVLEQL